MNWSASLSQFGYSSSVVIKDGSKDGDDPWAKLARENRAAATGEHAANLELGDTGRWLVAPDSAEENTGPSTEILQLVTLSLEAAPERADLWMMRFDVQKTLGLKREFASAMVEAWRNPRLYREMNWPVVRALWDELAPGEPLPEGVKLPPDGATASGATPASPHPATTPSARSGGRTRRFADLAAQIAGRELAVLSKAYAALQARPGFMEECAKRVAPMLKRPTPLQGAEQLSKMNGGKGRILLKREDLRTVTPEEENATAQAFVALKLGRPTVITGNDVDGHSLALARVAAGFQLRSIVVVRPDDFQNKAQLMIQLREAGAQIEVMNGIGMIGNDPREAALRLWQKLIGSAHLALSLGTGPSPYPAMTHNFQSLLGRETDLQTRALGTERPRTLVAAVQSEADSIGFMLPQLGRREVELVYAEPDPGGVASWRPSARLRAYNGAIREHAWLKATGRITHVPIPDAQARLAQQQILAAEKINVSLEDARAIALVALLAQRDPKPRDFIVLVA